MASLPTTNGRNVAQNIADLFADKYQINVTGLEPSSYLSNMGFGTSELAELAKHTDRAFFSNHRLEQALLPRLTASDLPEPLKIRTYGQFVSFIDGYVARSSSQ